MATTNGNEYWATFRTVNFFNSNLREDAAPTAEIAKTGEPLRSYANTTI